MPAGSVGWTLSPPPGSQAGLSWQARAGRPTRRQEAQRGEGLGHRPAPNFQICPYHWPLSGPVHRETPGDKVGSLPLQGFLSSKVR